MLTRQQRPLIYLSQRIPTQRKKIKIRAYGWKRILIMSGRIKHTHVSGTAHDSLYNVYSKFRSLCSLDSLMSFRKVIIISRIARAHQSAAHLNAWETVYWPLSRHPRLFV